MKKQLKTILIVLVLVIALSMMVFFVGCDKDNTPPTPDDSDDNTPPTPDSHTHTYGAWTVVTPATLFTDGEEERVCTDEDCDATDNGRETRVILADGKTNKVADYFTVYNDGNVTKSDNGAILGQVINGDSKYGPAIPVGQAFVEGKTSKLSFDLDLTTLEENDFTVFSLNFKDPQPKYVTEEMFAVIKMESGYKVAQIYSVNYANLEEILLTINASKNVFEFSDEDGLVTFTYVYSFDGSKDVVKEKFDCTLTVGDEILTFATNYNADVTDEMINNTVGASVLWNVYSTVDTVEFTNLTIAVA